MSSGDAPHPADGRSWGSRLRQRWTRQDTSREGPDDPQSDAPDALVDRLLASALVDEEWVGAQCGTQFASPAQAAARALLDGLSPHPLLDPALLARASSQQRDDRSAIAAFLDAEEQRSPHPFFDPTLVDPAALGPGGPTDGGLLAQWIHGLSPQTALPTRILPRVVTWQEFRQAALDAARAWHSADPTVPQVYGATASHPDDLASVVVPLPGAPRRVVEWMTQVAAPDIEVVVTTHQPSRACFVMAHTLTTLLDTAVLVSVPEVAGNTDLLNAGAAHASGHVVVLARTDVRPTRQVVRGLVAALVPGVGVAQPVVLDPHRLVQTAGLIHTDSGPCLLLAGHPASDAQRLGTVCVPPAASGVVALRREAFTQLGGLDPTFPDRFAETDLSLRARAAGEGATYLVGSLSVAGPKNYGPPAAVRHAISPLLARHHLERTDLATLLAPAGLAPDPGTAPTPRPGLASAPLRAVESVREGVPQLRWTIDTAAPSYALGDQWGDTFFAQSLATALESLGQRVAVDRREARDRSTRSLDDVVVVLRGLDQVSPRPGPVNIQWVISHPDQVGAEELSGFDLRFAASLQWSRAATARWGMRVEPLLQCTDPARFHPHPALADHGPKVLFVGNSRGEFRPVVAAAIEAGVDLKVYGYGWEEFLAPARIAAQSVPNDELGRFYASARVVLADHHGDMRKDGFLSNRLFDAVACGARVLSDEVDGITEVFGAGVQTYQDAASLAALVARIDSAWPHQEQRLELAARVAHEHSFARRAETLLGSALRHRAQRT